MDDLVWFFAASPPNPTPLPTTTTTLLPWPLYSLLPWHWFVALAPSQVLQLGPVFGWTLFCIRPHTIYPNRTGQLVPTYSTRQPTQLRQLVWFELPNLPFQPHTYLRPYWWFLASYALPPWLRFGLVASWDGFFPYLYNFPLPYAPCLPTCLPMPYAPFCSPNTHHLPHTGGLLLPDTLPTPSPLVLFIIAGFWVYTYQCDGFPSNSVFLYTLLYYTPTLFLILVVSLPSIWFNPLLPPPSPTFTPCPSTPPLAP